MNATQCTAADRAALREHILNALTEGRNISTARLARQTGLTAMDVARVIGDLETAGLVTNYGGTYALRRPTR